MSVYVCKLDRRLIALSLELPEDALVSIHNYDAIGETYGALDPTVHWTISVRLLAYPSEVYEIVGDSCLVLFASSEKYPPY